NSFNVTLQAQTSNAITGINYSSKASGSQSLSPVPSSITFIVGTGGGGGPTGAPTGAPTGSPTGSPTQQQGDLNHSINLGTQEQFTSLTLYGTKGEKASANAKQLIELNQALQFLQLNPQNAQQVGGTDMNILLWYTDLKTTVASALLQSSSGPSKNINDNIRLQGIISSIGYTTNLNPNPTYVYMPQMTAAGSGLLTANITYISTGASVPNVATVSLASGDTFASVTLYSYGQTPVAMSAANLVALNALVKSSSKTVAIWDSNSNSGAFIPNNGSSSSGTNTSIRGPICAIGYTTVKGDSGIQYVTIAGTMQMATVQVYTLSGIITSLYLETQNFANGKYSNSILDRFWSGHGYGILLPSGNNNYKAWIRFTEALNIGHTITATLTNNSMTFIDTTTNKPIAICNPSTINPQHSSGPDASPVVAIGISTVDSSYQSFSIQEGQTLTLVNVNGNLTVTIQ
ncbi:hypothetical protein HYV11_03845, partial [Candidatus Dependentiae bacterium]|nr:hypothetical protein [Candidatus Dependentiae bacterium]